MSLGVHPHWRTHGGRSGFSGGTIHQKVENGDLTPIELYGNVCHTKGWIMKITTYIDGALLKKALRMTGAKSQRDVLEDALRNLLADVGRRRFVKDFDSLRLGFTLKELQRRRA